MRDPQHELLLLLASLFLQYEKADQAVILLEALQVLAPADPEVERQLALAYLHDRRFSRALSAVDKYLEVPRESAESRAMALIRSRALWALGRTDEARSALPAFQAGQRSPG